jgi:FtsZ-interacting cell division protein ZipA
MPLWQFVVIIFGGLMIIGVVIDLLHRRKKRTISFDSRNQNPFDDGYDPRNRDENPF